MLELSDDDPFADIDACGEGLHLGGRGQCGEVVLLPRGDEGVGRESVGRVFDVVALGAVVDEGLLLRVQENVSGLVKEREPELILGLVAIAESDDRSSGAGPPGGSADAAFVDLCDIDDENTLGSA